jgi:hypothetical protein
LLIIALAVIGGLRLVASRISKANGATTNSVPYTQTENIDREFSFAAYTADKKLSDPIKYTITTAQLTNRVIIKGQGATAAADRMFLILNLKLVNDTNASKYINTRNYIRVSPAGSQDKLAPEIHNDTVEIQPLSTKLTRVGLPVNRSDKTFTIFVGEIDGDKQEINVSF